MFLKFLKYIEEAISCDTDYDEEQFSKIKGIDNLLVTRHTKYIIDNHAHNHADNNSDNNANNNENGNANNNEDGELYILIVSRLPAVIEPFLANIDSAIQTGKLKAIVTSAGILPLLDKLFEKYDDNLVKKIVCENPAKLWGKLCNLTFKLKPRTIFGVTGTDGKTSTCWFAANLLRSLGKNVLLSTTVGIYENGECIENFSITTPDSYILNKHLHEFTEKYGDDSYAVIEVSSIAMDQERVYGITFDTSVFTRLTVEHIEYHHTMQAYLDSKLTLHKVSNNFFIHQDVLMAIKEMNLDISGVNGFEVYGNELVEVILSRNQSTNQSTNQSESKLENYSNSRNALNILYRFDGVDYNVHTPFFGKFQAHNILSAIVLLSRHFKVVDLVPFLSKLTPPPGRMQFITPNIAIDFAHTSSALLEVLLELRALNPSKLICLAGSGGGKDIHHRKDFGTIMNEYSDVAIITTDNPRHEDPIDIATQIKDYCKNGIVILDRKDATQIAIDMLGEDDILVLAGKGVETTQIFANNKIIPYSDTEVVLSLLGKSR